jgi:soluble lytic murein transglycosylase
VNDGHPSTARRRVSYPRGYWPEVLKIGKEAGVDPYLVLAVARQESMFRPAIKSYAGATGVMQLMPGTAKHLAQKNPHITPEHAADLESPANSLRLGAYYLRSMLDRSKGNLVFALASYNAGPGNCDKWRAKFGSVDMETFIDSIPFFETREYVKIVLGNYAAYYSLYPPVE